MTQIPRDDLEDILEISKKICIAVHPFVNVKNYPLTLSAFTDAFAKVLGTIILKEDIDTFSEAFTDMLHQVIDYRKKYIKEIKRSENE